VQPAARERDDHLVQQPVQVPDRQPRHDILINDDAAAEAGQNPR
jgi:hypothetical protein